MPVSLLPMATATMTNSSAPANGKHGDTTNAAPNFPPPKTDKPRPHVCTTCGRSFARLEHLKRHERSHTKEKPFECPQCTRCFARRDLLLRHQQKLHQTGNTSSRPRGRRESASGAQTGARGRKNSIASTTGGNTNSSNSMRPRANTISHLDMATFNSLLNSHRANGYHAHHPSLNGYGGMNGFDFRGMSAFGHHGNMHGLPKIDTNGLNNISLNGGLRTAPILGDGFDFDKLFGGGSTINPAQLHFPGATGPLSAFEGMHFAPTIEDEDALDWTGGLGETLMDANGEAIADGSSPSAISTTSHSGFSEVMLDGSNHHPVHTSGAMWNNSMLAATNMANSSPFPIDPVSAAIFPELVGHQGGLLPTTELQDQQMTDNFLFSAGGNLHGLNSTAGIPGMPNQYFQNHIAFDSGVGSPSAMNGVGMNGNHKPNTMAAFCTQSITDATRQALLYSLSQPTQYGPASRSLSTSSPISPGFGARTSPTAAISLPATENMQRYVSAYIHYFHPHMPFLHIPTLTFDTPAFTSNLRTSHNVKDGVAGGGGCLVLAMAAIGASYEFDHQVGRELFESSKKMIKLYLDERLMAGKPSMGMSQTPQQTPTWLVQAMLLNLIYGHQCGDRSAAESATIQCAALVSLAKAAELDKPDADIADAQERSYKMRNPSVDVDMSEEERPANAWNRAGSPESREEYAEWYKWKSQEERKRTLYSVFVLSSLLVTGYNHQPRILNSELHLDLPCEEDLWAADNVHTWRALGGLTWGPNRGNTFAEALTFLLTASQRSPNDCRRPSSIHQAFGSSMPLEDVPESDLKPSTFGCYVLINALHVYIWETRQRHNGRHWKPQETEQMHAHIEPALRAWQSAWKSNPHHCLDRPNPYGPLAADSIPLLDLAYVRLFVNLGRSKEAFWNRDFEQMAKELGEGSDIIQNAEPSRGGSAEPIKIEAHSNSTTPHRASPDAMVDTTGDIAGVLSASTKVPGQSTKRERHLRKAAFYAADSLAMADRLGVTFAEFTSRELPIQSAICTFDCAQVLAEWVATIQERVGRYLGIIGRDDIDFSQVPAIMLLEEEDVKLIRKINEILNHAEVKIAFDAASIGTSPEAMLGPLAAMKDSGDGTKILLMTSYMLSKAAVWGITKVMSQAMSAHAEVLKRRVEASLEA